MKRRDKGQFECTGLELGREVYRKSIPQRLSLKGTITCFQSSTRDNQVRGPTGAIRMEQMA